jgi:putative sugar O-methyltransferase
MSKNWAVDDTMIAKYLEACKDFVQDDDKFDAFKQDPRYTPVLEHVTPDQSDIYISQLKSPELLTKKVVTSIRQNDKYGSPITYITDLFGQISPTTVRYTKNALDILDHFGPDTEYKKILEIGGGYGGLCKVLSSLVKFDEYYLVDLPEVSELSKKYLNNFPRIKDKISYITTETLVPVNDLDLVISNYAFSECEREYQKLYYDTMVKNAKRFYMVYNNFTDNMNGEEFISLASSDFSIHVEYETYSSHSNHIIYGTKL